MSRVTTSTEIDKFKNQIFSVVAGEELFPQDVQRIAAAVEPLFGAGRIWSIGAQKLLRINREAKMALINLFNTFRIKGGDRIFVIAKDGFVTTTFQMSAFHAGNIRLTVVKDETEWAKALESLEASPKKP